MHAKNSQIHKFSQAYHGWPRSIIFLETFWKVKDRSRGLRAAGSPRAVHRGESQDTGRPTGWVESSLRIFRGL